jgi:uncharacterized membrane protein YccC
MRTWVRRRTQRKVSLRTHQGASLTVRYLQTPTIGFVRERAVGERGTPRSWPAVLAVQGSDRGLATAVGSALAMGLPLIVLVLAGHPKLAVFAAFGAFTGLYATDRPYRPRARILAGVGASFVAAVGLGGTCALYVTRWWWVAAVAVVAAVAKWGCDKARLGPPGAWMFLFAFAAPSQMPTRPADVAVRVLLAAGGAAVAWCVAMLGGLTHPRRPERRATVAALTTTAEVIAVGEAVTAGHWHRAHLAINRAGTYIQAAPPGPRRHLRELLHRAEGLLTDAVLAPGEPTVAAHAPALLQEADALRHTPTRLRHPRANSSGADDLNDEQSSSTTVLPPEVVARQRQNVRHAGALRLLTASRVMLGTGVAGAGVLLLDIGHPYWAPVSAAAVLQSTHVRMTWHRSIQRGLGTAGGLLLAALVLGTHPAPLVIATLVVLMQLGIEVLLDRNYALGVLFITPVTMLLSDLLRPTTTYELVTDRAAGVALGILVGLTAAVMVAHPRAAVTLRDAMERCRAAMAWAGSGPAGRGLAATEELRDALVALRTAEDTARGETWPTGVSRSAVAEIESRAYRALATHRQALRVSEPLS